MPPSTYAQAGLPNSVLGIKCQSHRAGKIKHVLSYFKVNFRKGASKIDLLLALHTFAPTVSAREQQAIVTWLQAQNTTLGGLARAITEAREPTQTTEGSKVVVTAPEVDTKALKLDPDGNECPVCCNKLTTDSFPQQQLTSTCDHKPTFCFACLRRCVNDHIREDPWRPLQCPECKEKMEEDDVKRVVSAERFEKYKRNLEISLIRDLPNFIMCLNPTCNFGQLHKSGATQPVMTCEACSFQTCFNHNLPWHDDLTCDEFDQLHKEHLKGEEASEEYLLDNTKICPGPGCGIHTIKEGRACDHITCTACNFDYCWICLVSYDMVRAIGGTAHARTCHLWKEETPAEQKARKAEIRRVYDARRAEKSLKRKIGEVEDVDEGVEE